MRPSASVLAATLPLLAVTSADSDYGTYASSAFDVLQQWYNQTSGLYDTMGWWNGANGITTIGDLAKTNGDFVSKVKDIFSNTYAKAPDYNPKLNVSKVATVSHISTTYGKPPGRSFGVEGFFAGNAEEWTNDCYDDNGWWALAWINGWDITNEGQYIDTAKGIFEQMGTGGPSNCSNGGIIWCKPSETNAYYVNAIANELYLLVAARLAVRFPGESKYLDTAKSQWNWFKGSGMINSENLINDGLEADCTNNGQRTVFTYNQGVILGALVELDKAEGGSGDLISEAHTIASAAIANLTDTNHVLHEPCEASNSCAPDGTQFKGVFVRNLRELHKASPKDEYVQVIKANADSIWANDKNDQGQFSVNWAGPFVEPANASTHSSATDAIVAALAVL